MKRQFVQRLCSAALAVVLAVGLMPLPAFAETTSGQQGETPLAAVGSTALTSQSEMTTQSYYGEEKEITGLGTGAISNPKFANGGWNKVYFGSNEDSGEEPLLFNVLNTHETCFGGDTMFLDCTKVLVNMSSGNFRNEYFHPNNKINKYLNGEFLQQRFTSGEQDAIAYSVKGGHAPEDGWGWVTDDGGWNSPFCPIGWADFARIFILDAHEATNASYGFAKDKKSTYNTESPTRAKTGTDTEWWTRSQYRGFNSYSCVTILHDGKFSYEHHSRTVGVSPCLNVKLSSILYTSQIDTNTYKLTVKDNNINLNVEDAMKDFSVVTVPYNVTGEYSQLCLLLTDAEWTDSGWSNTDGDFVYLEPYERVYSWNEHSTTGVCTFKTELLDLHPGYNAYLIAERQHGDHETDYASAPVKLTAKQGIYRIADGYTGTYDGKAHGISVDVTFPGSGATVKYGTTKGVYDLDASPTITNVADSPLTVYYQITAPGFFTSTGSETVRIEPGNPEVPTGITAGYYDSLSNAKLPEGWSWDDPTLNVGGLGTKTFTASYTPTNQNFTSMQGVAIPVTVVEREHLWWTPSYEWNADNSQVIAKHWCFLCREEQTETVSTSRVITKQPTCSAKGESTYTATFSTAADFQTQTKTVEDVPIDHSAHNWGNWTKTKDETCEAAGREERVCLNDGNHKESREIAALGHEWLVKYVYLEDNDFITGTRTCVRCGKTYTWTEPFSGGHVHAPANVDGVEESCETAGTVGHVLCQTCGRRFTDMTYKTELSESDVSIAPTGHTWSEWTKTKSSTCSEGGTSERVCERDPSHKETRTDAIDLYAHEWGEWAQTTAPTCTKAGEDERVCKHNDSHVEKRVGAAATGHEWGEPDYKWADDMSGVTAKRTCKDDNACEIETASAKSEVTRKPTCVEKGQTTYKAEFKNEAFAAQTKAVDDIAVDPDAHNWGAPEYSWSADNREVTAKRVCESDPNHQESETVATTSKVTKAATCSEWGDTAYLSKEFANKAFSQQAKTVSDVPFDANAHDWGEWIQATAPTCTEAGEDARVCKHNDSHVEKRVGAAATGHDWGEWTVTKEATGKQDGVETRVCKCDASHVETRVIPATGEKSDLDAYAGLARDAFTDLVDSEWYMKVPDGAFPDSQTLYLDYVVGRKLMSGYKDDAGNATGLFGPGDTLSRAQTATILYRMANPDSQATTDPAAYEENKSGLPDVESGKYYTAAVNWCVGNGVITGYGKPGDYYAFGPYDNVSREQLATMIFRYCTEVAGQPADTADITSFNDYAAIGEWAREGVAYCVANKIVGGYTDGSNNFGPADDALRCQMAKIIAVTARMLE